MIQPRPSTVERFSENDLERLGGLARYKDVDGDGIGYRTLPGTGIRLRHISRAAADTTRRRTIANARTTTEQHESPAA